MNKYLEVIGRFSIVMVLYFLAWNVALSSHEEFLLLDWILLVLYTLFSIIWIYLPLIEIKVTRNKKSQEKSK